MQSPHLGRRVRTRTVVALYALVSVAWVTFGNTLAARLLPVPSVGVASWLTGLASVGVTAALLAVLGSRLDRADAAEAAQSAARERRFRLLTDHVQDVVSLYQVLPAERFEYVSPAVEIVLGYPSDRFYADPTFLAGLVHPDDRHLLTPGPDEPQLSPAVLLRVRHADGRWIWLEQRSTPVTDEHGRLVAVEGVARDVTEREAASASIDRLNRVLRTLSAANRAFVRADTEHDLVEAICQVVVDEGAYRFAWVGYLSESSPGAIKAVAHAGGAAGDPAVVSWWAADVHNDPGATSLREGRTFISRDLAGDPGRAMWRAAAIARGYRSVGAIPLRTNGTLIGSLVVAASETDAFGPDEVALLEELADDLAYGIAALRGRSAAARVERERRRLATIAEQSPESIVVTDTDGTIEYVNPAFERITGYSRAEVLGENPRLLKSGLQPPAFYAAMWAALAAGQAWVADFVNRRKDGSLFEEEAVVSPVRDDEGRTTGYVAVKRDVTKERAAEADTTRLARERTLVADTIARLAPQETPEATAQAICDQVVSLTGLGMAGIFAFMLDGRATPLAIVTPDGRSAPLRRLPLRRSQHLRERAESGPWVEAWSNRPWHPYNRALVEGGADEVACVPLRHAGVLQGLLVASQHASAGVALAERLPALVEFARMAGVTLGPSLVERTEVAGVRERVSALDLHAGVPPRVPAHHRHPAQPPRRLRGAHPFR